MNGDGIIFTVDQWTPTFEAGRAAVDVVCAGDSLTGWNNFGPHDTWPFRTYPDFLQELCDYRVANGGIAGEISDNGPQQVHDYLHLFPNARFFIMGMGTNDLGSWPDTVTTSRRIIGNLARMAQMVLDQGKQPILFNVPNANETMFPPRIACEIHAKRDFGASFACPGPTAMFPSFETRFARLEHAGGGRFTLSYMRHTDKWFRLSWNLTADECLDAVENDCHFQLI